MLPPLSVGDPQVVHITSVVAALHKLNVEIPVEDLIKAIHVEEDAKRVDFTAEATQYLAMLSKRKSAPDYAWPLAHSLTTNLFNVSSRSSINRGTCQS
jgi:hypothetical protein